jgi:hypothetical protein
MMAIYPNYVQLNLDSCKQPDSIAKNPKYKPFKHALGALNGVHVPARVPVSISTPLEELQAFHLAECPCGGQLQL